MLHKINQPACTQHLNWVVALQSDFLDALCDRDSCDRDVTVNWIKAKRSDVDATWIESFCGWSIRSRSILDRMRAITALPDPDKQNLKNLHANNLRYSEGFKSDGCRPPVTTPLPADLSAAAQSAYKDFFEMFYAPIFYRDKGYPIDAPDLNGTRFTKDTYLEAMHTANPQLKVCPLCDGGRDGAQLDHWLAKTHLPELNCHPYNLIEICSACNSQTNKGEKLALDPGVAEVFREWFHPYLRPAYGNFEIKIEHGTPMLASDNPSIQARLDKFNGLINLTQRWTDEYRTQMDGILGRLRHHRRLGKQFDEKVLRDKLSRGELTLKAS